MKPIRLKFPDAHDEDSIYRQLAWAAGLTFVDLRSARISSGTLRKVSPEVAQSRRMVPLIFNSRRAVLIVDDPSVPFSAGLENFHAMLGVPEHHEVAFALASPTALDEVLADRYAEVG